MFILMFWFVFVLQLFIVFFWFLFFIEEMIYYSTDNNKQYKLIEEMGNVNNV